MKRPYADDNNRDLEILRTCIDLTDSDVESITNALT